MQDELSAVRVLFELLGFLLRRLPTGTLFTMEAQRHGEKHFLLVFGMGSLRESRRSSPSIQKLIPFRKTCRPPDTSADFRLELVCPKNNSPNS